MLPELPKQIVANISNFTGRTWLLPKILKWFEQSNDRMFVLKGKPGSGKSSLMAWLTGAGLLPADEFSKSQLQQVRSYVKAAHFCVAESGTTTPRNFAENLANQLCKKLHKYGEALEKSLTERIKIVVEQNVEAVQMGGAAVTARGSNRCW